MSRVFFVLAILASVHEGVADSLQEGQCSDEVVGGEGDAGSLLQVRSECGATPCPKSRTIVIGAIKTVFHNVTGFVYAKALEQLGLEVQVVHAYGHYQLYPMFTGKTKGADNSCTEEGCAELCEAQGLGKSPCIDLLVDSQVPGYHGGLVAYANKSWGMAGTAFESWYQTLYVPNYAGVKTLSEAAASKDLGKIIYGFSPGLPGDGCEAMYCPACPGAAGVDNENSFPYIFGEPLKSAGYTFKSLPCKKYKKTIARKLRKKQGFLAYAWHLSPWNAFFGSEWSTLDLEQYRDYTYIIPRTGKPSIAPPGKALLRNAARHKFSDTALGVVAGIFIGDEGVTDMTGWAIAGGLCTSQSWDTACAAEAADKWINQNNITDGTGPSGAGQYGVWPSFFW